MRAREYRIGNYVTVRGVIQFIIGIESNNDWNVEDGLGAFETIRTNVNPMNILFNIMKYNIIFILFCEQRFEKVKTKSSPLCYYI